jgi:uncharacterized phage protein gp47/JayE
MANGVTPEGFLKLRLPEIRQIIVADMQARLLAKGLSPDIETRPDSVTGILIDTFAEREAAQWEMGEGVYYAMYPMSASGVALDRAVSFTGVERLLPEPSQDYVVLYGVQGTTVPAGSQIRNRITQNLWETTEDATISAVAAVDVTLTPTLQNSALYRITIDGVNYSYTSDSSATVAEVLAGLVAAVSLADVNATSDGATLRLENLTGAPFSFSVTANLTIARIGSRVIAQTVENIAESVSAGDLNTIVTLVAGWTSVSNVGAGTVGRAEESDAELRARYPLGVFRLGAATLPSLAPNLLNDVIGVTAVKVYENDTDAIVAGRKPHSVHFIVEGGLNSQVAAAIYKYKAAGIDTNGAVHVVVSTPEGEHDIYFDRPEPVFVWAKAALTILPSSEEVFPADGFQRVAASINATGQALGVGQDVLLQKFLCGIYQTPGIANVALTFAWSTNPAFVPSPGDYSASNITIGDAQRARFDLSRIQVS